MPACGGLGPGAPAGRGVGTALTRGVVCGPGVKALALDVAGSPQVVVTADLCGFSGSMTERLVAWAAATHNLERSQLILNCSHNHSGPVFDDVLPLYYDLTEQQLEVMRQSQRPL